MQYPLAITRGYCYCDIMDASGFASRLKRLREERGIGSYELSRMIGRAPSYVSMIETGARLRDAFPAADILAAIADALEVSTDLLLGREASSGNGQAPEPKRLPLAEILRRMRAEPVEPSNAIPIDEFTAAAVGPNRRSSRVPQGFDATLPAKQRRKKKETGQFTIVVEGRCMEPQIRDGDTIQFDTTITAEPGHVVVAYVNEAITMVKRLVEREGFRLLVANDEAFKPIPVDWRVEIVGVAVGGQYRLL